MFLSEPFWNTRTSQVMWHCFSGVPRIANVPAQSRVPLVCRSCTRPSAQSHTNTWSCSIIWFLRDVEDFGSTWFHHDEECLYSWNLQDRTIRWPTALVQGHEALLLLSGLIFLLIRLICVESGIFCWPTGTVDVDWECVCAKTVGDTCSSLTWNLSHQPLLHSFYISNLYYIWSVCMVVCTLTFDLLLSKFLPDPSCSI